MNPKYLLGSDLMAKIILRDANLFWFVQALIVHVGEKAKLLYASRPTEWPNGTKSDVVYTASVSSNELPPVLVEVQHFITMDFINRLMSYSLSIKKKLKAKPIVIVFGTHAIRGDVSKALEATEFSFMKQISCKYWAEKCYVLSQSTVGEASEKTAPLPPLMAIAYFFSSQKLSLMSTEYHNYPALQTLYSVAKEQTEIHVLVEQSTCDVLLEVCNQTSLQLKKILNALDETPDTFSKKHLRAYADDDALYTQTCRYKYSRTSEVLVESMPPPELPESAKDSLSLASFNTEEVIKTKYESVWLKQKD
ncbi:hypothetical protein G6F46_012195 [Rhizopus delemar]|uniref:Uncharacterized protein n=2 Tax=Rhizopus TaxID=4842 RepID=A0A9P7CJ54_9FUNG|nr:hypothetical protein G6F55_011965 [Rhizopus delemar]KAG1549948.1 hypothetical protein G6F51_002755 [Rhizopus arrhizus]KAG1488400.1 hypothetical protein G6F54_012095 [Rhizopus delemar]KAG1496499.1 hypothetical protein G6F53_012163 [Rhizopus delemar]KAG1499190.1 hypothetical protein G6F52_012688 [Rhizopus delemar]